jgi:hypothetical protein
LRIWYVSSASINMFAFAFFSSSTALVLKCSFWFKSLWTIVLFSGSLTCRDQWWMQALIKKIHLFTNVVTDREDSLVYKFLMKVIHSISSPRDVHIFWFSFSITLHKPGYAHPGSVARETCYSQN